MGGGTIIEPSVEDVIIPAFTNVDLTVKGSSLLGVGISKAAYGEFLTRPTQGTNYVRTSEITIQHGLGVNPKLMFVSTDASTSDSRFVKMSMINNAFYNGYTYMICMNYGRSGNFESANAEVTEATFKIIERATSYGIPYYEYNTIYRWIAIA